MITAKKSLGQNFLVDTRVSQRIVESVAPTVDDLIIEIGPGTGALTRLLAARSGHVVAVELDARLVEELSRSFDDPHLSIIHRDALAIDWQRFIGEKLEELKLTPAAPLRRVRVVANLPYYISTPIITRLIQAHKHIVDMTLMLQKEVVDRITAPPGGREYGYLSVLVQLYCQATKLFDVPPSAFKPAPKVLSSVVRLVSRERPAVEVSDELRFIAVVSAAFAQRRKTLANNMKAAASILKPERPYLEAIEAAGIDPKRRAETLSLDEFGSLYRSLYNE